MCLKSLCACLLNSGVQEQASSPSCIPSLLLWLRNRLAPALVWREAPTANPAWQMVLGVIQTLPITPLTFPYSSTGFTPVCLSGTWGWFCLGCGGLVFIYLLALGICLSYEFRNNTGQIYFCYQTNSEQNFSFVKSHICNILEIIR